MSVFLITSSLVTTWLIPEKEFEAGGKASGRALAYLAHLYLGDTFGTVYDISTIAILWFAGASAMAGLLNLIPRYLPRYGMAPEWTAAVRPLVLILTTIAFAVTIIFKASVDAQGGAYATGVLVLFTGAGTAVALAARKAGQRRLMWAFAVITVIFVYTTLDNIRERPDGVKIGGFFIAVIVILSILSRLLRAFELRTTEVVFDESSERFLRDCARRSIRLVANEPDAGTASSTPRSSSRSSRTTTFPMPATSSSSRSPSPTPPISRAWSRSSARSCTTPTASSSSSLRPCPTLLLPCCWRSAMRPAFGRTSTSSGPRATRLQLPALPALRGRRGCSRHAGGTSPGGAPPRRTTARPRRLSRPQGSNSP